MPKIISFGWTSDALLAGRKTATCRGWSEDYARRFRKGDLVHAYNRSPRYRGERIATIRLTHDATYGNWRDILTDPYEQEGFAYYDEQVAAGNAKVAKKLRDNLGVGPGDTLKDYLAQSEGWGDWVIRFEVVEIVTP